MEQGSKRNVLISVSDKTGIVEFARSLEELGWNILSTGGTAAALKEQNIAVTPVEAYTGSAEMLDGRVKTLHPLVHGAILGIRDNATHQQQMQQHGITPIDMVVVNLYPFEKTVAKKDVTIEEAVENIDIGGPSMVRSAAKNHRFVTIVVDPSDYASVVAQLTENADTDLNFRKALAVKAFSHTAAYDSAIEQFFAEKYLQQQRNCIRLTNAQPLRYGENPHQRAVFYPDSSITEPSVVQAKQLHGKELSYNNIVDGDAALETVKDLRNYVAAAVIKHTNPCGLATGKTIAEALEQAWSGDTVSAFGSVIAVTRTVDLAAAEVLAGRFVEMLIAPDFTEEALEYLQKKSKAIRLLATGDLNRANDQKQLIRHVTGGYLVQDRDELLYADWQCVTKKQFSTEDRDLAKFAWIAAKHVKSNAIILAQQYATGQFKVMGMGAGQPNRIDSLRKLAATKASENIQMQQNSSALTQRHINDIFSEMVLASDAFFPFADSIEAASALGISKIVQPGGSVRDSEVIEKCDELGVSMVFTSTRHFRH